MAKRKYINIKTGPLTAGFCHLDKPDTGREFSTGKFSITVHLDPSSEENKRLKVAVKAASDAEWPDGAPQGAFIPGANLIEADPDNPDKPNVGMVKWTFKSSPEHPPTLSKAGSQPLAENERITGGDIVRIAGAAAAFVNGASKGVTLYLNQVRLVEKRVIDEFGDDDDVDVPEESSEAGDNEQSYNF